jgi:anti-sigma factor RsiW
MKQLADSSEDALRAQLTSSGELSFEVVLAYVDDELPPETRAEVERLCELLPRVRLQVETLKGVLSDIVAPLPDLRGMNLAGAVMRSLAAADRTRRKDEKPSWSAVLQFALSAIMYSSRAGHPEPISVTASAIGLLPA